MAHRSSLYFHGNLRATGLPMLTSGMIGVTVRCQQRGQADTCMHSVDQDRKE